MTTSGAPCARSCASASCRKPCLRQFQARRRPAGARLRARRPEHHRAARRQVAGRAPEGARRLQARRSATCWWPPTWPRAASTSSTCRRSSTTTCPSTPRTTSTASAAPAAPALSGLAVTLVTRDDTRLVADIERLIKKKLEIEPFEFDDERPRRPPRRRDDDDERRERGRRAASRAPRAARTGRPAVRSALRAERQRCGAVGAKGAAAAARSARGVAEHQAQTQGGFAAGRWRLTSQPAWNRNTAGNRSSNAGAACRHRLTGRVLHQPSGQRDRAGDAQAGRRRECLSSAANNAPFR